MMKRTPLHHKCLYCDAEPGKRCVAAYINRDRLHYLATHIKRMSFPMDIWWMFQLGAGMYAISHDPFNEEPRFFVHIELEENGVVHQLTPTGRRDGELRLEWWPLQTRVYELLGEDGYQRIGMRNGRTEE